MKKSLLYIFVATQLAFSCQPADQDNLLLVPTCMDGLRNGDEEGIDCGGPCTACSTPGYDFVVPCEASLVADWVMIDDEAFSLANTAYTIKRSGDGWGIDVSVPDGKSFVGFSVHFYGAQFPKEDIAFVLDDRLDFGPGKAYVGYAEGASPANYNWMNFYGYTGRVYLVYQNGKPVLEICPIKMRRTYDGVTHTFSGKLNCKF